jgi:hypothetical protein
MKYVAPIVVAIAFAFAGDAGLYAFSQREHRKPPSSCLGINAEARKRLIEETEFEFAAVRVSGLLINGTAVAVICAALFRLRRDRERIADDGMTA